MSKKIRILIADDHKVVREGLRAFLAPSPEYEVIGEANNGAETVDLAVRLQPDVILLDMVMPVLNGIRATQEIIKSCPNTKVLIISSFVEESQVIEAIRAGASGYLLKDSSPEEIETAIQNVIKGDSAFPPRIASILVREINRPEKAREKTAPLTEREIEILKLLAHGMSNQDIADRLFLSVWTVRTYVTGILNKLQVENRTQATLYALREGLVKLDE
jgi:two-component system, NarL family, response regulator LiaR